MGRLKEAWLTAVENGTEEEFLSSFPNLTQNDIQQFKRLMDARTTILDMLMFGVDEVGESSDGESEGLSDQGS